MFTLKPAAARMGYAIRTAPTRPASAIRSPLARAASAARLAPACMVYAIVSAPARPAHATLRSAVRRAAAPLVFFIAAGCAHAGSLVWSQDAVSPPLNHRGAQVIVRYSPPAGIADGHAGKQGIVSVHAGRSYSGNAVLRTSLCWNSLDHCVPMAGSAITTDAFNGLDASRPMFLVHEAPGKGPLPAPVFVKGRIAVWYGP